MRSPLNQFPDFVRQAVRELKNLCPSMGKVKIAQTLARAGLHLVSTTVGRILNESSKSPEGKPESQPGKTKVRAEEPEQIHHLDLTTATRVSPLELVSLSRPRTQNVRML